VPSRAASDPAYSAMVQRQEVGEEGRPAVRREPTASRRAFGLAKRLILAANAFFLLISVVSCRDDANILTASTPASVLAFEMRDAEGITIWRIVSHTPQEISVIRYGEVPQGFSQEAPVGAPPRPLRTGELITTTTEEPDRTFRHDCEATNEKGLRCGVWESTPRKTAVPR
jgi:hypothetical protein